MSTHAENVHLMNENSDLRKQVRELAAALRGLLNTRPTYSLEYGRAEDAARASLAKLDSKP